MFCGACMCFKLIEKVVAWQLNDHFFGQHFEEKFHSDYKKFHSTETALLRVQKDIVTAVDKNISVILLVLDLSATFDSVDHGIIISRLSTPFGVKVTVLGWLKSNLTSRTQFISVNNSRSSQRLLKRGFPQGSVLGPLLYKLYTHSPFADIVKSYNLDYNYYADDTQHYLPFSVICSFYEMTTCKSSTENGVSDIDNNRQKLNRHKTESLLISSRYCPRSPLEYLRDDDTIFAQTPSTRNLHVVFDQCYNPEDHVKAASLRMTSGTSPKLESTSLRIALYVWYTLQSRLNVMLFYMLYFMDFHSNYFSGYNQFKIKRLEL